MRVAELAEVCTQSCKLITSAQSMMTIVGFRLWSFRKCEAFSGGPHNGASYMGSFGGSSFLEPTILGLMYIWYAVMYGTSGSDPDTLKPRFH